MDLLKDDWQASEGAANAERQIPPKTALLSNRTTWLAPLRRFNQNCPEWLDRPETDPALLREELEVLEGLNRRLGGHALVLHYVKRCIRFSQVAATRNSTGVQTTRPLRILDLGTGRGDIPRAIVASARRRNVGIAITAVDVNPNGVRLAAEACFDWPEIRVEQHDMLALPYPAASFDLVLCSLALHHFGSADAVRILGRMQELSRLGYIVNDLRRNWLAIWLAELFAHTIIRSRIVRHDLPGSCRAAFTVPELQRMASEAGLANFQIRRHHGVFRMVLEGRK